MRCCHPDFIVLISHNFSKITKSTQFSGKDSEIFHNKHINHKRSLDCLRHIQLPKDLSPWHMLPDGTKYNQLWVSGHGTKWWYVDGKWDVSFFPYPNVSTHKTTYKVFWGSKKNKVSETKHQDARYRHKDQNIRQMMAASGMCSRVNYKQNLDWLKEWKMTQFIS